MVNPEKIFRAGVLSVVKHDYLPRAVAAHPRFELLVVADDGAQRGVGLHGLHKRGIGLALGLFLGGFLFSWSLFSCWFFLFSHI